MLGRQVHVSDRVLIVEHEHGLDGGAHQVVDLLVVALLLQRRVNVTASNREPGGHRGRDMGTQPPL